MIRINVGCGPNKLSGFINVDANPSANPDITAPATHLPFSDSYADVIEAYHLIEHLEAWEAEIALREWFRVLKPGGKLCIECPNLAKIAEWLVKSKDYTPYAPCGMGGAYGESPKNDTYMTHRFGYTPQSFGRLLGALGFRDVIATPPRTHHAWRDMRIECVKGTKPQSRFSGLPQVFWLLYGDRSVASSRLQGHMIHQHLLRSGFGSHLVLDPAWPIKDIPWHWHHDWKLGKLASGGIVIMQKMRGARSLELAQFLRRVGVKVIYVDCDYDSACRIGVESDAVVCPSEQLAQHYRDSGAKRVFVIPDPIEIRHERQSIATRSRGSSRIHICWFGCRGNWTPLEAFRELLAEPEFQCFELLTISDHPDATYKWSLDRLSKVSLRCEVAVFPTSVDIAQSVKSNNRVTQAMALGLAVVAGRIQAYETIIRHGQNGLLAGSVPEYRAALRALKSADIRRELALAGYDFAVSKFQIDEIGKEWERVLRDQVEGWEPPAWLRVDCDKSEQTGLIDEFRALSKLAFLEKCVDQRRYKHATRILLECMLRAWHSSTVRGESFARVRRLGRRGLRAIRNRIGLV